MLFDFLFLFDEVILFSLAYFPSKLNSHSIGRPEFVFYVYLVGNYSSYTISARLQKKE